MAIDYDDTECFLGRKELGDVIVGDLDSFAHRGCSSLRKAARATTRRCLNRNVDRVRAGAAQTTRSVSR